MKRFSWFTDGVRESATGRWVSYEDHLAIVKAVEDKLASAYEQGYKDGESSLQADIAIAREDAYDEGYEKGASDVHG